MTPTTPAAAPRAALLAALLATLPASLAFADGTLFRWSEPDGSVTFSPVPPIDGTPFTAVDPATLRPPGDDRDDGPGDDGTSSRIAAANVPAPRAERRSFPPAGARASGAPTTPATFENGRCTELSKRVVSLERRLMAPLTPEEMDETVIRMAGYQRSFESLCL